MRSWEWKAGQLESWNNSLDKWNFYQRILNSVQEFDCSFKFAVIFFHMISGIRRSLHLHEIPRSHLEPVSRSYLPWAWSSYRGRCDKSQGVYWTQKCKRKTGTWSPFNPWNRRSDKHLNSPHNITPNSHIRVTRRKEMIMN